MDKTTLNTMLAATIIFVGMIGNSMAVEEKFVGCIGEEKAKDACEILCNKAGHSLGYSFTKDSKKCKETDKPMACFCNVKK